MTLTLHNLLMRLGSPTAHAIFLGLAIAFMSLTAHAQDATPAAETPYQLFVADDTGCIYCQKFKAEVGATYDSTEYAERATLSYITYGQDLAMRPDLWPDWFKSMVMEGRLTGGPIGGTPTFLIAENGPDGKLVERARIMGYGGPEWFYERLTLILDALDAR